MTAQASDVADLAVEVGDDHVATVELRRPPNNHIDTDLVRRLGDALLALDDDPRCRAVVLCSQGRHFCGGADLTRGEDNAPKPGELYAQAVRLFEVATPMVAAVQGAAVGGGLGLALVADFRVASPAARFVANFARLGFHQGFGSTVTLPAVVGRQQAAGMLYTGRRVGGEEAVRIGLADRIAPAESLRSDAHAFAAEIAASAPLAVRSIRATVRAGLASAVRVAVVEEAAAQERLIPTADFAEGLAATMERRVPRFVGA